MHSGPDHFLVRPGVKNGKPGPIVPLIAVDQLPDWMQVAGVPRELDSEQTNGLTNVGVFDRDDDDIYEVRLHHDKIRAILETTMGNSIPVREGKAQRTTENPASAPRSRDKSKVRSSKQGTAVVIDCSTPPGPNVITQKQTCPSSQGEQDDDSKPGTIRRPGSAPVHKESSTKLQGQKRLQPTERMLSASRRNAVDTVARRGKPILPHMTQAMYDKNQLTAAPRSSSGIKDRPKVVTGSPGTVFCRHWCHHGTCKWGWNCKFQHRMPTTFEGLREVGLKGFPTWYLLIMAVSPSFGLDRLLLGGLCVDDNKNSHPGTTNNMTITSAQQHPSPMDACLTQECMSTLLAGHSGRMSNRQRLRQDHEMRNTLLPGDSRMHSHVNHLGHANLHTNASVAANAAIIRQQAERQLLGRQSGLSELSDLPVATRAARVRATVEIGGDDADDLRPGSNTSRDKCDNIDTCAEGDERFLVSSHNERVSSPRHAKLVDID